MKPIVWMSVPLSRALCERLPQEARLVGSVREFVDAQRDAKTVSFLDHAALQSLDQLANDLGKSTEQVSPPELRRMMAAVSVGPVIAVADQPLQVALGWLPSRPWLSHVIGAATFDHPDANAHLANVMTSATASDVRLLDWLKESGGGRRVQLTHASRRGERLERMSQYLSSHGIGERTIQTVREAADELLINAFYGAPLAAGIESKPIPRAKDVALPDEFPCDLAYGVRDQLAFVRVRDPFGALSRHKLVDALVRHSREEQLIGLWKVVSAASVVAISVITNRHTEVMVGIPNAETTDPPPFALHMFSKSGPKRGFWQVFDDDTGKPTLGNSVTVTFVGE